MRIHERSGKHLWSSSDEVGVGVYGYLKNNLTQIRNWRCYAFRERKKALPVKKTLTVALIKWNPCGLDNE